MTDLPSIDPHAQRWIDRHVSSRLLSGLSTLIAAELAPCGDVTALYSTTDGQYHIFWFVNDEDAFDIIGNECGAEDLERARVIYEKWAGESREVEPVPDWEAQAAYDDIWGPPLEMNREY